MNTEINNTTKIQINEAMITRLAEYFGSKYKLSSENLSIAIVDDETIAKLNEQYRFKTGPTDVLSFDGDEDSLGEILVDIEQIKRQEKFYSEEYEIELLFIILHGLLHLLGYEDKEEEDRLKMIEIGKDLLDSFLENKYDKT